MKRISSLIIMLFVITIAFAQNSKHIVILHTNDTHSRIEPSSFNDKRYPDKGGVVRRLAYVEQVRRENKNVILLDAGDFVQGTPYFNLFKGEVEIEAMNRLKYDAIVLGNHEFDLGMDVLYDMVVRAKFPIVCSNYDFSETKIAPYVKSYIILKKDGVKIGIIGTNVDPVGLIATSNYEGMKFLSPEDEANKYALLLKEKYKCDLVIAISHRGLREDIDLAGKTNNIDIIIGGHSHTLMENSMSIKNKDGKDVVIHQVGDRGTFVGRIDVTLEKKN